jgi:non-ribosomal peptide synthetase component F
MPLHSFLLQVLLHKYTAQDDIVVGTPYANRDVAAVQGLMGPFLNTLALRLDLAGDPPFSTVLTRAKAAATQAFLHGSAPFAKVVESLGVVRSAAFTPIYQVLLPPLIASMGRCSMSSALVRPPGQV